MNPGCTQLVQRLGLPPIIADRYDIQAAIGSGAMGLVVRARDTRLGRTVAIKFLTQLESADALKRFDREGRALAAISHPAVVPVYDLGSEGKIPYLVMEFMEGGSLEACLTAPGGVPLARGIELLAGMLSGLEACHGAGLVHRDLKPANILLASDGSPKISDLGISAMYSDFSRMTDTGVVLGTPLYMAPERLLGQDATPASDIYAVGCMAYELLGGRHPFPVGDRAELWRQQHRERPPLLHELCPEVPERIALMVARMLENEPERRPGSIAQLVDILQRGSGPAEKVAAPATATGRRRLGAGVVTLMILLICWGIYRQVPPAENAVPSADPINGAFQFTAGTLNFLIKYAQLATYQGGSPAPPDAVTLLRQVREYQAQLNRAGAEGNHRTDFPSRYRQTMGDMVHFRLWFEGKWLEKAMSAGVLRPPSPGTTVMMWSPKIPLTQVEQARLETALDLIRTVDEGATPPGVPPGPLGDFSSDAVANVVMLLPQLALVLHNAFVQPDGRALPCPRLHGGRPGLLGRAAATIFDTEWSRAPGAFLDTNQAVASTGVLMESLGVLKPRDRVCVESAYLTSAQETNQWEHRVRVQRPAIFTPEVVSPGPAHDALVRQQLEVFRQLDPLQKSLATVGGRLDGKGFCNFRMFVQVDVFLTWLTLRALDVEPPGPAGRDLLEAALSSISALAAQLEFADIRKNPEAVSAVLGNLHLLQEAMASQGGVRAKQRSLAERIKEYIDRDLPRLYSGDSARLGQLFQETMVAHERELNMTISRDIDMIPSVWTQMLRSLDAWGVELSYLTTLRNNLLARTLHALRLWNHLSGPDRNHVDLLRVGTGSVGGRHRLWATTAWILEDIRRRGQRTPFEPQAVCFLVSFQLALLVSGESRDLIANLSLTAAGESTTAAFTRRFPEASTWITSAQTLMVILPEAITTRTAGLRVLEDHLATLVASCGRFSRQCSKFAEQIPSQMQAQLNDARRSCVRHLEQLAGKPSGELCALALVRWEMGKESVTDQEALQKKLQRAYIAAEIANPWLERHRSALSSW